MIDVEDSTLNLFHNHGRLLLGGEFLLGGFVSNEGGDIGNIVQLQEDVYGRCELVEACLILPRSVVYMLKFW